MASGTLTIDLEALTANWRTLDAASAPAVETAAVVKADAYGLGMARTARALARAGVRSFFVATAEEGAALRRELGDGPPVFVFSGHMAGDTALIGECALTPLLNSPEQIARHRSGLPGRPFGIQIDTGMNRLGIEEADWRVVAPAVLAEAPTLLMSHLACADDPDSAMNPAQLVAFRRMSDGTGVSRSLAGTGGILLGRDYHFDLTRPGIGIYGGLPFQAARPVVQLSLPVIQTREVAPGETVGYANTWTARAAARIATVSGGFADGLMRAMTGRAQFYVGATPCPVVGRVSMDLIGVDISHLDHVPERLDVLCAHQLIDALAAAAGTIGHEILTSLGARYDRRYRGEAA